MIRREVNRVYKELIVLEWVSTPQLSRTQNLRVKVYLKGIVPTTTSDFPQALA